MDPRDDYRRLQRMIIGLFILIVILIMAVLFYVMSEISNLHNAIGSSNNAFTQQVDKMNVALQRPIQVVEGKQGDRGNDGKDSVSTNTVVRHTQTNNVIEKVIEQVAIPGAEGPQGLEGAPGNPAREIELCRIKGTTDIGQRFVGTKLCNPIEVGE